MNLRKLLTILSFCLFAAVPAAAEKSDDKAMIKKQASEFMASYLGVYNRRFGKPEASAQFRQELSDLVTKPFMQAPPIGQPVVPELKTFTRNFETFLTRLEARGVTKLQWARTEYRVLSPNKVLVNNVGQGIKADGGIGYETISLYLLHRTDEGWRIALFSPYLPENAASIVGANWEI